MGYRACLTTGSRDSPRRTLAARRLAGAVTIVSAAATMSDRDQAASVEGEIRTLIKCRDACERGRAVDSANLSFYREMISLQEELLADWRVLSARDARTLSRT
jgi:hypothetical protein